MPAAKAKSVSVTEQLEEFSGLPEASAAKPERSSTTAKVQQPEPSLEDDLDDEIPF